MDGGYRNTAQRAVILDEVRLADGHLTAGEIFERVRRRDPRIAYGTVYRALHLLAKHGLVQELTFADQASRYDKRVDRHDHVPAGCFRMSMCRSPSSPGMSRRSRVAFLSLATTRSSPAGVRAVARRSE